MTHNKVFDVALELVSTSCCIVGCDDFSNGSRRGFESFLDGNVITGMPVETCRRSLDENDSGK